MAPGNAFPIQVCLHTVNCPFKIRVSLINSHLTEYMSNHIKNPIFQCNHDHNDFLLLVSLFCNTFSINKCEYSPRLNKVIRCDWLTVKIWCFTLKSQQKMLKMLLLVLGLCLIIIVSLLVNNKRQNFFQSLIFHSFFGLHWLLMMHFLHGVLKALEHLLFLSFFFFFT